MGAPSSGPHVVVLSSLFPSSLQPGSGLFVRERAFRLGRRMPLQVLAPTPWFPLQRWLAKLRPGSRPGAPQAEVQRGFSVTYPRFLSIPAVLRRLDGLLMALCVYPTMRRLRRNGQLDVIDSHFGYPDGYAAGLLGRWLKVPVTITLRGTESRQAKDPTIAPLLRKALLRADRVFSVSESLRQVALSLGVNEHRTRVVGNGVDLERFFPLDPQDCRAALNLPREAPILVSVGGLVERKGFHRVIELLPQLRTEHPGLQYLVVGGPSPEGDWTDKLKQQVQDLGLTDCVHFSGPIAPDDLKRYLSAADLFVLSTRNEGWANVFLEAMACGLPVITTHVGGNAEVVCRDDLGTITPFGDAARLSQAISQGLRQAWDRAEIRRYAEENTWDRRIDVLDAEFRALCRPSEAPDA